MSGIDTSMGGSLRAFPQTTVGLVARLADPRATVDRRATLELLSMRYWKAVYCYVRIGWSKSNADAKDLTQAFFLSLSQSGALTKYDAARSSFRGYLKLLLKRFLGDQEKARKRLKRGGGARLIDLDEAGPLPDPRGTDPEAAFDRAWLGELLDGAVEQVRARFEAQGRARAFAAFDAYELAGRRRTYAEIAAELGVTTSTIRNDLFAVREAIRSAVRAELAGRTGTQGQLDEAWSDVLGR